MKDKKINKAMLKSYHEFNIIIISLAIAMIFLPLIIYVIRLIYPNMIRCPYYELTLKPCPFCGFTTDLRNILKGKIFAYKYNILSVPCLVGAIIEIIARFKLIRSTKWHNNDQMKAIMINDLIVHLGIFMIIVIYIVCYFIFDLRRF